MKGIIIIGNFDDLIIKATNAGNAGITIVTSTTTQGTIAFSDGTSGTAQYNGYIQYSNNGDKLALCAGGDDRLTITSGGSVNIGGDYAQTTYKLKVTGSFAATTKSFVIDHPTKENHSLRYACLEGPENSVYVRGRSSDPVIELPEYWVCLVHDD